MKTKGKHQHPAFFLLSGNGTVRFIRTKQETKANEFFPFPSLGMNGIIEMQSTHLLVMSISKVVFAFTFTWCE